MKRPAATALSFNKKRNLELEPALPLDAILHIDDALLLDHSPLNGTGFKATRGDLTCRNGFKYEIDQVYEHSGPVEICKSGFHLCKHLQHTFAFYSPTLNEGNRYFVVSYDDRQQYYDENNGFNPKVVTKAIRLKAEIKVEEILEMTTMVKRYPTEHMLLYIARHGSSSYAKEVIKQLSEAGADVHAKNDKALQNASFAGHTEVVRLLLLKGADLHAQDNEALRWASEYGHTDVVRLLLDRGSNVHADDDYALRSASERGYTEIVGLLLEKGADVHTDNNYALRRASRDGRTEVVRLLLDSGADVHARDDRALRHASNYGRTEVVRLLLEAGADVHSRNNHALRKASKKGHTEIVKMLLDHGADVHAQDDKALRLAIKYGRTGRTEVVGLLLKHGANMNAVFLF